MKLKNMNGIYRITNLVNGKIYIGSASGKKGFSGRWTQHKCKLKSGTHSSNYLQNSYKKYGVEAFAFNILLVCDKEQCLFFEQLYLDAYKSYAPTIGYNVYKIAGSALGYKHTMEAKIKMSIVHKGKIVSAEARDAMSKAHSGALSENHLNAIRTASQKRIGYKHNNKAKAKMSASAKKRKISTETREKMLATRKANYTKRQAVLQMNSSAVS